MILRYIERHFNLLIDARIKSITAPLRLAVEELKKQNEEMRQELKYGPILDFNGISRCEPYGYIIVNDSVRCVMYGTVEIKGRVKTSTGLEYVRPGNVIVYSLSGQPEAVYPSLSCLKKEMLTPEEEKQFEKMVSRK